MYRFRQRRISWGLLPWVVRLAGSDPYRGPRSGVLRNRLGVTDAALLEQTETDFSASRLAQLRRRLLPGNYDLRRLCLFHQHSSSDVYPWARQIRTVAIFKGDSFCLPQQSYVSRRIRGPARQPFNAEETKH
jgi:fido (protein-threonine AMPylation protein)